MNVPFGDLRRQVRSIRDEVDEAISKVLDKAWFIFGENVEAFEQEFSEYCGAGFGIGVGSGTEAIHLALLACGIQPGDEVITVANTAVPTISAISFANAVPVFVDIDPDSYTMDPSKIEGKITEKTKVILPVHLYGQCADMAPILEVARRHGLKVVEDACQAHGAEYKGRKAGSLGDMGCFSFYPSKNLGACGDGGMVVTNREATAAQLKMLRNYGQEKRYVHTIKGFNSRLDEMQAAVLRVKLPCLNRWNARRRRIAALYEEGITCGPIVKPQEMAYAKHMYHLYVIRTPRRDRLQEVLRERGIGTLNHYPVPVHLQRAYLDLGVKEGALPVTETVAKEILSLPMFPELTEQEVGYICEAVNSFIPERATA